MITDNENGFLVPLFDYAFFQARLASLMQDDVLRENFGEQAGKSIRKFSVENIGEKFFQFILPNN
jgi:glycosyltransferase involved in cell wall biosynthesis